MSRNDFISRLNDIVECLFEGDIDEERREVLEYMFSRIKDEDEHLKNQDTYRRLKELLHDSYLPGKPIEYIDKIRNIRDIEELSRYGDIVFLPREGMLYVVGDTHGDPISVGQIVRDINFRERAKDVYLVFLGDYVNNGLNSIDNLITVLSLKEEFPDRVVLLGGNHESRESFHTALNEYFIVHWNNAKKHPFLNKYPPNHYGHIRLELIMCFGVERGTEIYKLFVKWGQRLPYVAFSAKGVMMSHSIGLPAESRKLRLETLAYAKRHSKGKYVKIVSNRDISQRRLDRFMTDLGVNVFVVGHSHYRSGDVEENGRLVTICSSDKRSEAAGHYMENEFRWERLTGKGVKEGRQGEAAAYYAMFDEKIVTQINRKINLCLVDHTI